MSTVAMELPRFIVDDGKVYERVKDTEGLFQGYAPLMPELPKEKPYLNFVGPKIPLPDWRSVAAFFKWAYDDCKSEVQVRLYFNKENGVWKPWAFPQKHGTGMTTTELPEKEGDERVKAGIAKGWIEGGTIHSHCSAGAFQSGTDRDNERTKNGVHITIGKIDKDEYDIHGRVSFKGTFYDMAWRQWFDFPEGLDGLPFKFRDDVMKFFLTRAVADDQKFPDEWKANVIKTYAPKGGPTGGFHAPQGRLPWGEYDGYPNGGHSGGTGRDDERGVLDVPAEEFRRCRDRRTKREKKELRKELKESVDKLEKAELADMEAKKINEAAIEVIRMCSGRAIDVDEMFILTYRDARFLDKEDDAILDEYEAILKKANVLAKDVEDWIHELTIAGLEQPGGGGYAG